MLHKFLRRQLQQAEQEEGNKSALTTAQQSDQLNLYRLERTSDPHTVEFSELLSGYGLAQHVSGAT